MRMTYLVMVAHHQCMRVSPVMMMRVLCLVTVARLRSMKVTQVTRTPMLMLLLMHHQP